MLRRRRRRLSETNPSEYEGEKNDDEAGNEMWMVGVMVSHGSEGVVVDSLDPGFWEVLLMLKDCVLVLRLPLLLLLLLAWWLCRCHFRCLHLLRWRLRASAGGD